MHLTLKTRLTQLLVTKEKIPCFYETTIGIVFLQENLILCQLPTICYSPTKVVQRAQITPLRIR